MLTVPASEINPRINTFQKALTANNLDAALLFTNVNLFYFGGSTPSGALWIPKNDVPRFLIRKGLGRVKDESPLDNIIPVKGLFQLPQLVTSPKRLGLELDQIPVSIYNQVKEWFPNTELVDISYPIRMQRMIKSDWEVDCIRYAAKQQAAAYESVRNNLKEGMTELELSAAYEYTMRLNGHQGNIRMHSFGAELYFGAVAAGESAAYPIAFDGPVCSRGLYPSIPGTASHRKIKSNETIMIDMVGAYMGYHSDETRIFCLGEPPVKLTQAHQFVIELMDWLANDALKAGASPIAIWDELIARTEKAGYGDYFQNHGENQVKFLAHGIGLEVDEIPVIMKKWKEPLQAGMVLAVEPKIIFPEGGVGLENTYLIKEDGVECLTKEPELDIIIV